MNEVMNKEVRELFNGKYCDVSICSPIMEENDIRFCAVGYDEEESLFIIDKNGVHFELNGNEIDNVEVDSKKKHCYHTYIHRWYGYCSKTIK